MGWNTGMHCTVSLGRIYYRPSKCLRDVYGATGYPNSGGAGLNFGMFTVESSVKKFTFSDFNRFHAA